MKTRLLMIVIMLFLVSILLPLGTMDNAFAVSVTIQPSLKDTFISEFEPSINFGTDDIISVFRSAGQEGQVLVEFSMASIPTGATIDSAVLGLYVDNNVGGFDIRMQARRITSTWTETVVIWNTRPSTTVTDAVTIDSGTSDGIWLDWNITGMVDDWVNNAILNEGVLIKWIAGGAVGALLLITSREYVTASLRPQLVVIYTPPEPPDVSYLVYLAGGIDNVTSWVGATGTEFNVRVENRGNVELTVVDLELYNHTAVIVTETDLFNIEINEIRNHQFILTHGLSAGTYSWQFQAHYQGDTEYWNFTLYINPDPVSQIFVAASTLQPQQIDTDTTATVSISINNVGGSVIAFRIQATSISLIVSPTTAQQIILQAGTGQTIEFLLYPQTDGFFYVDVLVTPINQTTGVAIGSSFFTRHLLRVTIASSVTTFSADDIGINDAILQGKINSLGGFDSGTVYFTFWQTGLGVDSAYILPPNKQVVSFISDYRVWVGDLVPETQYSYEFRMEVGSSASPIIYYGGIINFTTTLGFSDPFTAARNGLAQFLGIDSISMGIILATLFVVFSIIAVGFIVGDRLEGMAQSLAIGISGFAVSAIFFSIGYYPIWILVFLGVICAAIIIGLPTFQKGAPSE